MTPPADLDLTKSSVGISVPFQLELPDQAEPFVGEQILRRLDDRRLVARGKLGQRNCVLKLFFGRRHLHYFTREFEGIRHVQSAGVATPELIDQGTLAHPPCGYLVFCYLEGAHPVPEDPSAVAEVAELLAKLHLRGLQHHDTHLDNFLRVTASGESSQPRRLYAIDGDGVRPGRIDWRARRDALAVLWAQLPACADPQLALAADRYLAIAGRQLSARQCHRLRHTLSAAVVRQRSLRTQRYLGKTLRDCTEFFVARTSRGATRRFYACRRDMRDALTDFAKDPEKLIAAGHVIKGGNSATVVRVVLCAGDNDNTVIVKRYNIRSLTHRLRQSLRRRSRARRLWQNGHRLRFLRIPTANPLALYESRRWGIRQTNYVVMEDLGDLNLADLPAVQVLDTWLGEIVDLYRALADARLVHGDTKASNFIVGRAGLAVIDLDGMVVRRSGHKEDRARFLANWSQEPQTVVALKRAFDDVGLET